MDSRGKKDLHVEQGVAVDIDNVVANTLGVITHDVDSTGIPYLGEVLGSLDSLGAGELRLDGGLSRLVGEEGLCGGSHCEGAAGGKGSEGEGGADRHEQQRQTDRSQVNGLCS